MTPVPCPRCGAAPLTNCQRLPGDPARFFGHEERWQAKAATLTIEEIWDMQFCSNEQLREHAKLRIAQRVLRDAKNSPRARPARRSSCYQSFGDIAAKEQ